MVSAADQPDPGFCLGKLQKCPISNAAGCKVVFVQNNQFIFGKRMMSPFLVLNYSQHLTALLSPALWVLEEEGGEGSPSSMLMS